MTEQDMLKMNIDWAKQFLKYCVEHDCPNTIKIVKQNIKRMEKKWKAKR